jgi:hypothetical protein
MGLWATPKSIKSTSPLMHNQSHKTCAISAFVGVVTNKQMQLIHW